MRRTRAVRASALNIDLALLFLGVQEQVFSRQHLCAYVRRKYGVRHDAEVACKPKMLFLDRNAHQLDYLYRRAKEQYRVKARELHPDCGGSHEAFVTLNKVWDYVQRRFKAWGVE